MLPMSQPFTLALLSSQGGCFFPPQGIVVVLVVVVVDVVVGEEVLVVEVVVEVDDVLVDVVVVDVLVVVVAAGKGMVLDGAGSFTSIEAPRLPARAAESSGAYSGPGAASLLFMIKAAGQAIMAVRSMISMKMLVLDNRFMISVLIVPFFL